MLSTLELKQIAYELHVLMKEEQKKAENIPEFITQNRAFRYKGCTRKRINEWVMSGELKILERGNRKMFSTADLDKLLNRPTVKI